MSTGTGCKGFVYRGWNVRYGWDARKGVSAYLVTNVTRPGVTATFDHPRQATAWIDKQERKAYPRG